MDANKISLDGKVAIVTGAGMGMGAATARLMAARGAKVVVADRNPAAAEDTAATIRAEGGNAEAFIVDVTDEAAVAELVAYTVRTFGRLDCAVNNAAIAPDSKSIAEADMAEWDRVIAVNLRSVMLCLKYEIAQMLRQGGGGAIVCTGSVSSVRPQPSNSAYVAAKHGVVGLIKTAALEYAAQGIRVNTVLPGAIDTPMLRSALQTTGASETDTAAALTLFGRLGAPSEVAEANAWLCSDAASFITGAALAVDAGYLAR
jgi:NAD(P)-dependent dehydrogenase (short-subunit alcohol dehydrogenase family)